MIIHYRAEITCDHCCLSDVQSVTTLTPVDALEHAAHTALKNGWHYKVSSIMAPAWTKGVWTCPDCITAEKKG